jgi:bifunctional pyridoxal-dependent enzyme with beta-cystathionase and maltose regulon repressor activities
MRLRFDEVTDRRGTNSLKWEFAQQEQDPLHWEHTDRFFGEDRILPMWVANMDFSCPEPVVKALVARAQKGIYGYTVPTDTFYQSVVGWMARRHRWVIAPEWICITPGVVPALNMLVRTFISPGDRVLIQPPVYYPFYSAIENNGGEVVRNPLVYEGHRFTPFANIDYDFAQHPIRLPLFGKWGIRLVGLRGQVIGRLVGWPGCKIELRGHPGGRDGQDRNEKCVWPVAYSGNGSTCAAEIGGG